MPRIDPHEARLARDVFEHITTRSWFNGNAVTEKELLKLILREIAAGATTPDTLLAVVEPEAERRFARSPRT